MTEQNILDQITHKNIHEMAESIAIRLADDAPPDPLHPKELLKKQIQIDMQTTITQFFETFVVGIKELLTTLARLSVMEPELFSDEISAQFDKIGDGISKLSENPDDTKSLREMSGITNETIKAFNRAVSDLYEKKQYDKASAVYSFLTFLDPNEPAYWLGLGNSEFFQKNYEKALSAYSSVISLNTQNPVAQFYSAHCYLAMDQTDKAIEMADQALEVIKNIPSSAEQKEQKEQAEQFKIYCVEVANQKQ